MQWHGSEGQRHLHMAILQGRSGGGNRDRPWSISYRLCGENHIFVDPRRFVIDFHTKMWQSAPQKTDIYME